jgi:hypothetical protein
MPPPDFLVSEKIHIHSKHYFGVEEGDQGLILLEAGPSLRG